MKALVSVFPTSARLSLHPSTTGRVPTASLGSTTTNVTLTADRDSRKFSIVAYRSYVGHNALV